YARPMRSVPAALSLLLRLAGLRVAADGGAGLGGIVAGSRRPLAGRLGGGFLVRRMGSFFPVGGLFGDVVLIVGVGFFFVALLVGLGPVLLLGANRRVVAALFVLTRLFLRVLLWLGVLSLLGHR